MTTRVEWRGLTDFAEIAEALGCDTRDVMAALVEGGETIALYTTFTDDNERITLYKCVLQRDADQILVPGPSEHVATGTAAILDLIEISDH